MSQQPIALRFPGLLRLVMIATILLAVFLAGVVIGQGLTFDQLGGLIWRTYAP